MTIRDYHDPEPYEWEDGPGVTEGRCACGPVRPLRNGICRQCAREQAERREPRASEYKEATLW